MKYTKSTTVIQQNISGGEQYVTSFVFSGCQHGPNLYLQGNLHGPEIIGSVILTKLVEYLSGLEDIAGTITIVPTANPIGALTQVYGYQVGRWNMQNGKNWNRIFKKGSNPDNSIESKLAKVLLDLAAESDIVLDIHASGKVNVPHLYTYGVCAEVYKSLEAKVVVLFSDDDFSGVFDETCFLAAKERGKSIAVATWEAGTHGDIRESELIVRFKQLLAFLSSSCVLPMTDLHKVAEPITFLIKNIGSICSPRAGYIVWKVASGVKITSGQVYAELFQPWKGSSIELKAERDIYLISQFALQAVASGQEIAKVAIMGA